MPVNLFTLLSSHLLLVKNCSVVCHIIVMCQTSAFVGYCFQGTNLTVTVSLSKLHTQNINRHFSPKTASNFLNGKNIHCMYSVFPKGQNIINLVENPQM